MKTALCYFLAALAALLTSTSVAGAQGASFADPAGANTVPEEISLTAPFSRTVSEQAGDQDDPFTLVANGSGYDAFPRLKASASLLYLQPSSGSLEYGTLVYPFPAASPHWENQAIRPNFTPAFDLGLSYLVPETGNDLRMSWTHLDSTSSASFAGNAVTNFAGPSYLIGPGASNYNLGSGSVNFRYDAVNFEAGHLWRAGRPFQVRMFGGVQYGSIRQNLSSAFADSGSSDAHSNAMNSEFAGAGPRLGVNGQYNRRHLQFVGEMAATALIGTQQTRMDFNTISTLLPAGNPQSFTSPNATQIVPGLDSRLGTAYSFRLGSGIVKIEAGYQAMIYMDAINSYTLTQVATPPVVGGVGVFYATAEHLQNNFTAHGPYLSTSFAF